MSEREKYTVVEFQFQEFEQKVAPTTDKPCGCCMSCIVPEDDVASNTATQSQLTY